MNITLVELRRPVGEQFWQPFSDDEAGQGFNRNWWRDTEWLDSRKTFIRALDDGDEVARISLDEKVEINHYAGVPDLGTTGIEIKFFEVHADRRLHGIGHTVIEGLYDHFPGRRLIAFSMHADGFWESLGWNRYVHADSHLAPHCSPLYIQPAR